MTPATITRTHVVLPDHDIKFPFEAVGSRGGPTGRFIMEVPRFAADGSVAGERHVECVGYVGLRKRAEGYAAHAEKLEDWK